MSLYRRLVAGELQLPVYAWERALQGWVRRASAGLVEPLTVANFLLADEAVVLALASVLFWLYGVPALAVAVAVLVSSTKVEEKLKALFHRGRPRDEAEWGIPSGDCVLVAAWTPLVLGWWAVLPIALVAWARMARDAHWPLDVVAGAALGLALSLGALRW